MHHGTKILKFMMHAEIKGLGFNNIKIGQPPHISLRRHGRAALEITLRPNKPDDDPFGYRNGLHCRAIKSVPISSFLFEFVDNLNSGIFTIYDGMRLKLPHVVGDTERIAIDGTLANGYSLPRKYLPPALQELSARIDNELRYEMEKFIKQLVWYFNIDDAHNIIEHATTYWKAKGRKFYYIETGNRNEQRSYSPSGIVWNEIHETGFMRIWKARSEEPLAHELFREAGSLVSSAPRSSLLILFNALEVRVKNYICLHAPQTQWLMREMQSPPISKILKKFIPTLKPTLGVDISRWSELTPMFNRIEKRLTPWRNNLAHRGEAEYDAQGLMDAKDDICDILYILDYLSGEKWAINNIRTQTCLALGWPEPKPAQNRIIAILVDLEE